MNPKVVRNPKVVSPGPRPNAASLPQVVIHHNFATVYEQSRTRLVRGLALSLRDEALANEAIDEAFTRALQRWNSVGQMAEPQAWIYRTAHNWATSRFRRRTRDKRYAALIARPEASTDHTPDPHLAAALQHLSVDQREVLVLRYFLDWSIDSCAEALDIAPGTVKSRTNRALNELHRLLEGS